ncbi:hypothetical protein [Streptosporangium sp. KLBMP 9127]|nr:hypothetical protein [Streptosporangium sp. KLBMP 9127]
MGFVRTKTTGFTAIIPTRKDPWQALFLRDDQVAKIDIQGLMFEGPLAEAYGTDLAGLPEPFASCTDAAFQLGDRGVHRERTLFIAGDLCLDWLWGVGPQYTGPVTGLPDFGPFIPPAYRSEVDVALQLPGESVDSRRTLLFKGDQCVLIRWGHGVEYEGPITGLPDQGWKSLPKQLSGDFDHAVHLASEDQQETLFIKGDQAMIFHWHMGWRTKGSFAQVLSGLGFLPAPYRTPRLPAAGRFIGTTGDMRLDLRVDLEGELPVVSGDLFVVSSGGYSNSFVLNGGQAVALPAAISGTATFAFRAARQVSVAVDKLAPGGTATATISETDGTSTVYTCSYVSRFLRTIDWEVDAIAGTKLAGQYATTADPRPPGLAKRVITVQAVYAEAGIELRTSGTPNEVAVGAAGEDLMWSNAELHAAMLSNFSGHEDTEQWKLWSFMATRHADNDGTRGIMFDAGAGDNFQRQGIALFYTDLHQQGYAGTRKELRTHVHEIGHALNLYHSFQKNLARPPQPLGPRQGAGDLSFMQYVDGYEGPNGEKGEEAFWAAFAWRFTDNELRHLRHGFYWDVVMGGFAFGQNAADRPAAQPIDLPPPGRSGLRLELSGRDTFSHGEPIVTELKLSLDGSTPQADAFPNINPRGDNLTILITDPAGAAGPFRPIARACGDHDRRVTLNADTPALYDSAYLGYGADGLTFAQPGTYRLRAVYRAPDGSTVTSPEHAIEVSPPRDDADQEAGDLLMGSQQGTLLALLGSDAPQLQEGNDALDQLLADHPDHPLAVYALMVKGTNAGRHFLTLGENGIDVRPAETTTSIEQLGTVVATTLDESTDAGVDNITLNATMRRLARAHARDGDLHQADAVLDQLVDTFRDKDVPPPVLATIAEQAETTRIQLHDQA